MNWSKTKSIFIISFLLLDIFLGYQLYHRQKINDLDKIDTQAVENLQKKDIKIEGTLPTIKGKITFLKGERESFLKSNGKTIVSDLKNLQKDSDGNTIQKITTSGDGTLIISQLKSKINVPKTEPEQVSFLGKYVIHGDQYQFWKKDNAQRQLIFVQSYNGQAVFSTNTDQSGVLKITYSSDGKVTGYTQSYLDLSKPESSENKGLDLISPSTAIDNILQSESLAPNIHPVITKVALGYYSLIGDSSEDKLLVFVPIWHVNVKTDNGTDEYFVNAIYGTILPKNGAE